MITILESPETLDGAYISTETAFEVNQKLSLHRFNEVETINCDPSTATTILTQFHALQRNKAPYSDHPIYKISSHGAAMILKGLIDKQPKCQPVIVQSKRRAYFRFEDLGIPYGAILTSNKTDVQLMVVWDNHVLPSNSTHQFSLTAATTRILKKEVTNPKKLWYYNGESVDAIYERHYAGV